MPLPPPPPCGTGTRRLGAGPGSWSGTGPGWPRCPGVRPPTTWRHEHNAHVTKGFCGHRPGGGRGGGRHRGTPRARPRRRARAASAAGPGRPASGDLGHPPSTAAQLRVGGTAGRRYGASGVADIRTGRPVETRDRIRIGGITEVFVATVVLRLVAEGRVALDAPVRGVLPGLLPARFSPVTVAHLLNHTSGLPDQSASRSRRPCRRCSGTASTAGRRGSGWRPRRTVR
ncbi:serine hydrolase domain-containing protein [Streptomyces sp. NPDC056045]|uniref:serine hydrolase domain-containing protein n=1 Tax=Streptomyces sp. NPDC056045 TaxID=3345691 RepID=UPI0035DBEEC4